MSQQLPLISFSHLWVLEKTRYPRSGMSPFLAFAATDRARFAQKRHCGSLQTESSMCEWVLFPTPERGVENLILAALKNLFFQESFHDFILV